MHSIPNHAYTLSFLSSPSTIHIIIMAKEVTEGGNTHLFWNSFHLLGCFFHTALTNSINEWFFHTIFPHFPLQPFPPPYVVGFTHICKTYPSAISLLHSKNYKNLMAKIFLYQGKPVPMMYGWDLIFEHSQLWQVRNCSNISNLSLHMCIRS